MSKKPIKKISHTLEDPEQIAAIAKRMKRANGQMSAVVRMLEEGRSCEDIVTQMAAVGKAINTAAFTLISASLKECLEEDKSNSAAVTEKLQKLFLSLA
jgi:DNA-binding FrmR family transcriptional regulator